MEKAPARSLCQCFSLVEAVGYLVLDHILFWACRLQKLSPNCSRTQESHSKKTTTTTITTTTTTTTTTGEGEGKADAIGREDVEMVMGRIGILFPSHDGERLQTCMAFDDLSNMFEEEEPSLEEIKEVFCVFDENRDGFIDASELQSVLSKLGLDDGTDLDACRSMIAAQDQDHDGRIDFNGFVRFMERSV